MPEIVRSALLPYPAEFLYQLVNDVRAYPEFLPWCGGAEVHAEDETSLEASLLIQASGLRQWFRTRNRMVPGASIEIELVDGPFESMRGNWRFSALADAGCKIEFRLAFEIKRRLTAALIAPTFTRIANTMVDSFCQRARQKYDG